jgi:hypothetical protein
VVDFASNFLIGNLLLFPYRPVYSHDAAGK